MNQVAVDVKIKKLLTILAVLAVALAVLVISTEAMRGGMRGGSGGMGGSGGGIAPVPDGNYDAPSASCGNYNGNYPPGNYDGNYDGNYNGNYPPGNYDAIEVCVSTDKSTYTEVEPIEITVTGYNPTGHPVGVDWDGCGPLGYTIDGRGPYEVCGAFGTYVFQPHQTIIRTFNAGSISPGGSHSVVGTVGNTLWTGDPIYESDPLTVFVLGIPGLSCPQYAPYIPGWCEGGIIIPGEIGEDGCQDPPSCLLDSNTDNGGNVGNYGPVGVYVDPVTGEITYGSDG